MATTYTLISSVTVGGGGAATMSFTSIPATYTDLVVKISGRAGDASGQFLTFNGNSSNYSYRTILGDGSSASSGNSSGSRIFLINGSNGFTSNTFGNAEIYIPNYASANYKSVSIDSVNENNASTAYVQLIAGLWSNTAAITTVTLTPEVGSYLQYSTAYLYGISNA